MPELLLIANISLGVGFYIFARLRSRKKRVYLPDFFIFMLASHFAGSLWLSITNQTTASAFLLGISSIALFSATLFGSIVIITSKEPKLQPVNRFRNFKTKYYTYVLFFAFLINIGIFASLMSNPAIRNLAVLAFFSDDAVLLDVRKAITASTEGYMNPGLIKLLRDIFSPIAISAYIIGSRSGLKSVLLWATILSVFAAVLIGGQRFPMMALTVMIAVAHIVRTKTRNTGAKSKVFRKFLVYGIIGFSLFSLLTQLLGRGVAAESPLDAILAPITGIAERIFFTVLNEANRTFFFWQPIGPTYGLSWISDLVTLVPGVQDSSLSSLLHQAGGGSAQGNAPLFFAADSWLAFGHLGVALSAMAFFLLYHFIDKVLWTQPSPLSYAARFLMMLNIPMMYSPFLFLLNGGILILPLVIFMLILPKRTARAANLPRHTHAQQSQLLR